MLLYLELLISDSIHYSQTGMIRQILVKEGIPGLYRGLTSLLSREIPGYFCFFYGYAGSIKLLSCHNESRDTMCKYKHLSMCICMYVLYTILYICT